MNIPFFNYKKIYLSNKNLFNKKFISLATKGAFIMQKELEIFEKNICVFTKIKYCLGVANATDALELLLIAADIKKGDEVIFCSHTMIATASAIKSCGATPVPIDCDEDHLIDINKLSKAISKNTKALIVTQLNGRVANMDKILSIVKKYKLKLFEDSAQALGAKFKSKSAGSFGLGGCISFYPAKILGCFGDGGAVITNSKYIYEKIKILRDHGRSKDGEVTSWGYNSRLDNIQAGILNVSIKSLRNIINKRRLLAKMYFKYLKSNPFIKLPPKPNNKQHFDTFQNFEIEAKDRDSLRKYLLSNKIGTILQWGGKAVHEFSKLGFRQKLNFTEKVMRSSLLRPMNPFLTKMNIKFICTKINKFYDL
jgi:dTDP-4-amino-4,6-dideoxygalactose transaminase